jgi:hypothetical protein
VQTGLDRLLDALAPERTLDVVAARADQAVNTFNASQPLVGTWPDFMECLGRFLRHVENNLLRLPHGFNPGTDYDALRALPLLREIYGPSGEKAAFEITRTGAEGGLRAVLQAMAQRLFENTARREIHARVNDHWCDLTTAEQLATPEEYLQKYGHLLPAELTEGRALRVFANFPRVLEEHPYLLQRLRQASRTY